MGRTTSIVISTNSRTKVRQTQDVWFGDGEIRLGHECGKLIGEYAKVGGYYVAVLIFKDDTSYLRFSVQSISPPLTTVTQAAQAVARAWLACKALEGFAEAAASLVDNVTLSAIEKMSDEQLNEEQRVLEAEIQAAHDRLGCVENELFRRKMQRTVIANCK